MSSPEERQPGLVTPEDSKVRMAGLENLVDTPQKRMKAVVLTGLTGVLAMEAFSVAAQAEPGEVAQEEEPPITPTPEAGSSDIDSYLRENLGTPFADLRADVQNYLLSTLYQNLSVDGQAYASEHFGEIIVARRDAAATPTPEAGRTLVAQVPTPTPGETLVAAVPVNEVAASMMEYPGRVSYVSRKETPVNFNINWTNVEPLMGSNGQPIQPGLYEDRPAGFSLDVMNNPEMTINGEEVDLDYMVGVVSLIEPRGSSGTELPIIYVTVPMRRLTENGAVLEESSIPRYGTFQAYLLNSGNRFAVLESNGSAAALPAGYDGDNFSSSNWGNTQNLFQFDQERGVITIPTAQGPVELRQGSSIAIEYVGNMEEVLPDVTAENGRTPDQVIEDYMNGEGNLTGRSGPRSMIWPLDIVFPRS